MRRSWAAAAVASVVVATACGAGAAAPAGWIRLAAEPPLLHAHDAWTADLTAARRGRLVLRARLQRRVVSFHVYEQGPRRFRAVVRFPTAGTWRLSATLSGRTATLARVRVAPAAFALDEPAQLLVTRDGTLLVTERGSRDRIIRVDPATGAFRVFATGLEDPWGLAYAPDGTLLVSSDSGMYRVPAVGGRAQRFLDLPASPFVPLANGDLLLAHLYWVGRLRAGATDPDEFPIAINAPHGMALAPDGSLFLTDTGDKRILRIDPTTGSARVVAAGRWTPLGLALEPSGSLLVVDFDAGTLVRVSPTGKRTTVARGLVQPYALARAPDGTVYVTEAGAVGRATGMLERVEPDGTVATLPLHPAG